MPNSPSPSPSPSDDPDTTEVASRRPLRAVVIDDEYGARLQVELALLGSQTVELVGEASNGMRGAELVEATQPDVVVLDLSMPVMDGFEAMPLIRRLCPAARIAVRSSHDDPEHRERALRAGAVAYLPKFLSPDELRASIEGAAAARSGMPSGQPA